MECMNVVHICHFLMIFDFFCKIGLTQAPKGGGPPSQLGGIRGNSGELGGERFSPETTDNSQLVGGECGLRASVSVDHWHFCAD